MEAIPSSSGLPFASRCGRFSTMKVCCSFWSILQPRDLVRVKRRLQHVIIDAEGFEQLPLRSAGRV